MMQLVRIFGILLGVLLAVGFGLCGAIGVLAAGGRALTGQFDPGPFAMFLACGLAGLAICWACARAVWVAIKGVPGAGGPPAQ